MDKKLMERWLEALKLKPSDTWDLAAAGYGQPVVHTVIRHVMENDVPEDSS